MNEQLILVEQRAGYRILTLNRPDRLNAFNDELHRALQAALKDAEADPDCRALLDYRSRARFLLGARPQRPAGEAG